MELQTSEAAESEAIVEPLRAIIHETPPIVAPTVKNKGGRPRGRQVDSHGKALTWEQKNAFKAALIRACKLKSKVSRQNVLVEIANVLLEKALDGNMEAIKEVVDRVDGKAVQQTEVSGTVNHVQVFLKGAQELEQAMLKVNEHRMLPSVVSEQ